MLLPRARVRPTILTLLSLDIVEGSPWAGSTLLSGGRSGAEGPVGVGLWGWSPAIPLVGWEGFVIVGPDVIGMVSALSLGNSVVSRLRVSRSNLLTKASICLSLAGLIPLGHLRGRLPRCRLALMQILTSWSRALT